MPKLNFQLSRVMTFVYPLFEESKLLYYLSQYLIEGGVHNVGVLQKSAVYELLLTGLRKLLAECENKLKFAKSPIIFHADCKLSVPYLVLHRMFDASISVIIFRIIVISLGKL